VVSNQTNNAGAVKTYPNVHKDYSNAAISSLMLPKMANAQPCGYQGACRGCPFAEGGYFLQPPQNRENQG
jgi:hypothetical protein